MCSPFSIDIRPRRLPHEINQIEESSNDHGIHCYLVIEDSYKSLEAKVPGPKDTPYEEIIFRIAMDFDSQYPFCPPNVKFITPVYHPNIDTDGKICLDVLRMPPGGSYNPAITLEAILLSIQLLLASPNPDDPLRDDVSDEYRYNRDLFNKNAKKLSGENNDSETAGNSSKKFKPDSDEMNNAEAQPTAEENQGIDDVDDDDKSGDDHEMPNTSNGNATNEVVSLASLANRKRKHDGT